MSDQGELLQDLADLSLRPLDFVYWAYPWGEAGTDLAGRKGPEPWQTKVLTNLQAELLKGTDYYIATGSALSEAYQVAVRSGHDIGKTAFLCWIIQWAISTRENTRGRATANTEKQLRTILWAELAKWHRLFIGRDLFNHTATAYHSRENPSEWRIDAVPWSEDNTQAFAGMHNFGKRLLMLFDEASSIHDGVWEVADGVTHEAETEIIWIVTGNPTQNHGRFKECWGRFASNWHTYKVDSREVSFTNSSKIDAAIQQWGESSDYVKVRYLGEFPDAASTQLIEESTVRFAQSRPAISSPWEPLILTADIARFGSNETVIGFRRGKDARTIPALRLRGLSTVEVGNRIAGLIVQHDPDQVFIDEGGVGGGVVDFVRHLGHSCMGVNFGSQASTRPGGILVGNKRAEMYVALREWLREGGCIETASELYDQLVAIEYFFNKKQEIMLVSKEDMEAEGVPSPDWADQLALSFAYPVAGKRRGRGKIEAEYNPLGLEAFRATVPDEMMPVN